MGKRNKRHNYGDQHHHTRKSGKVTIYCIGCGKSKRVNKRTADEHSWLCDECKQSE